MLSLLALNVRYAARQLAAHPGFSLFAAFSLAIGIAASITLFSAADALLFAPLHGVGAPDDLVELTSVSRTRSSDSFSAPDFEDYATRAADFADRKIFMFDGRVVDEETMHRLRHEEDQRLMRKPASNGASA